MSVSKLQVNLHWGRKRDDRKDRNVKLVVWRADPGIPGSLPLTKRKIPIFGVRSETQRDVACFIAQHGGIIGARQPQILWDYTTMRAIPRKRELCVLRYSHEARNTAFAGFPRAARFRVTRLQRGRFY
jgi:hypothetical protein